MLQHRAELVEIESLGGAKINPHISYSGFLSNRLSDLWFPM